VLSVDGAALLVAASERPGKAMFGEGAANSKSTSAPKLQGQPECRPDAESLVKRVPIGCPELGWARLSRLRDDVKVGDGQSLLYQK